MRGIDVRQQPPVGVRTRTAAIELARRSLITEGWPLSFIQAQLGIKTLYAMDRFLKHLDMPAATHKSSQ